MQTPTTSRGKARHEALINAARDIFLEQGYARTTLDMIIARSGGSRRTLYECFGDKAGLFRAVISLHTEALTNRLQPDTLISLPAQTGLSLLARAYLDMVLSADAVALYRLLVAEAPNFPELGQAFYQAGPQTTCRILERYLHHLMDTGHVDIVDITLASRQFLGLIKSDHQMSALLYPQTSCHPDARAGEIASATALFLSHYQRKESKANDNEAASS